MIAIAEVLVVEGRYDVNTLKQMVSSSILKTDGFAIFKDKEMQEYLRLLAKKKGLLILTDSDGAGLVIRNFIKNCVGGHGVKHAYIPEIIGKERRKTQGSKAGTLGVEGMSQAVLREALQNAGATIIGEAQAQGSGCLQKADLFLLGLTGGENSVEKRKILCKTLGIPTNLSANALLSYLNISSDKAELEKILQNPLTIPSDGVY